MRKYKRYRMRLIAEKNGMKPSKYVHDAWNAYQVKRLGYTLRLVNVLKGTAPKRRWKNRIRAELG